MTNHITITALLMIGIVKHDGEVLIMSQVLEAKWQQLCEHLKLPEQQATSVFLTICESYREKHRIYHTLSHLEYIWQELDTVENQSLIGADMQLAVWYHSIVYRPGRNDNETKSVTRLQSDGHFLGIDKDVINAASDIILAKVKHQSNGRICCDYFLDINMVICGAQPEVYQRYVEAITKENKRVPRFMFRRRRTQFLRQTLSNPKIFLTEHFAKRYEYRARQNLNAELTQLQQ